MLDIPKLLTTGSHKAEMKPTVPDKETNVEFRDDPSWFDERYTHEIDFSRDEL